MANRFAQALGPGDKWIGDKLERRNAALAHAREGYRNHTLPARDVVDLVAIAREYHRSAMWGMRERARRGRPYAAGG